MSFSKLAPEIWLEIGHYVDPDESIFPLGALARVNRQLHHIFHPELYRRAVREELSDITLYAAGDGNLDTLKVAAQFGANFDIIYPADTPDEINEMWADREALEAFGEFGQSDNEDGDSDDDESEDEIEPPEWAAFATPLCVAAKNGHYDVVKWLLARGVNVNTPSRFICDCVPVEGDTPAAVNDADHPLFLHPAWTPLHYAMCGGNRSIARLLLTAGADQNVVRSNASPDYPSSILSKFDGRTSVGILAIAIHDVNNESVLHPDYEPVRLIHEAASSGDDVMVKELVKVRGEDVDTPDGTGATPLHYAIMSSEHETVTQLLSLGADPTRPFIYRGESLLTIGDAIRGQSRFDDSPAVPAEVYINTLDYAVNNDIISDNVKDKMVNFYHFHKDEEDEEEEKDEEDEEDEDENGPYMFGGEENCASANDRDYMENDINYPCSKVILEHGGATWVEKDPFAVTEGRAYPHSSLKLLLLKSSGYWSSTDVDADEKARTGENVCKLLLSFIRSTVEHAGPKRSYLIQSEVRIAFLLALINPHFQQDDINRFYVSALHILSIHVPSNMFNSTDNDGIPRFLRTFGRRDLGLDDKGVAELTSLSHQPSFHNFALCFLMRFAPLWPHTENLLQKVRWLTQQGGGVGVSISRPKLVDATPIHTYLRRVEASFRNDSHDPNSAYHFVRQFDVADRIGANGPKDMENICNIVNVLGRNGNWLPLKNGKGKDAQKVVDLFAALPQLVKHGLGKRTKQSMPRSLISKLPGL